MALFRSKRASLHRRQAFQRGARIGVARGRAAATAQALCRRRGNQAPAWRQGRHGVHQDRAAGTLRQHHGVPRAPQIRLTQKYRPLDNSA